MFRQTTMTVVIRVLAIAIIAIPFARNQCQAQDLARLIDDFFSDDIVQPQFASDAEFIRRASIDLIAMPPTSKQVATYVADSNPKKRKALIEKLIDSPQFDRHLATSLDLMLMERRTYGEIKQNEWEEYLLNAVRENKPWNLLARELMSADGADEKLRPAVRFALARQGEPNLLTRDIGRIFFGRDLQCAQCHDHPLVEDYLQSDYQGLLAFLAPSYVKTISRTVPPTEKEKKPKKISIRVFAEKDGNDINFSSVFIKDSNHRTGPRLIGRTALLEPDSLPTLTKDAIKPVFSRRNKMAELATDGSNKSFNENIANRLWAHLFGSGLVQPLDFHHRDNPPLKPELMKLLGQKIVEFNFDIKRFLKEIALTNVYQRSFDFPDSTISSGNIEVVLTSLENSRSALEAKLEQTTERYQSAADHWESIESKHIPISIEVEKQSAAWVAAGNALPKLKDALSKSRESYELQSSVGDDLIKTANSLKKATELIPDDNDAQKLLAAFSAKAEKIQKASKSLLSKTAEHEKKYNSGIELKNKAEKSLQSSFEKRRPIRLELDAAELAARKLRNQVETLMTKRNALDSEIATLKKLDRFALLDSQKTPIKQSDSGLRSSNLTEVQEKEHQELFASLNRRFETNRTIAMLKPLTPEQLCLSALRVTGFYDRQFSAQEKKLRTSLKLPVEKPLTRDQLNRIESNTYTAIKGHISNFVRYYGAGAGQPQGDFFATADQALFAVNGGSLNSYVNPTSGNVTDKIVRATDFEKAAAELFLCVLSRFPTDEEKREVVNYLSPKTDPKEKRAAAIELVWGLLNSAEFRFNH